MTIPVIDIRSWTENGSTSGRKVVAEQVGEACREIGFFAITNHGVDTTTIERAWSMSRDFFDLPLDKKLKSKTDNEAEYPYGYENAEGLVRGKKESAATLAPADLKETFSIGPCDPLSGMPERRWPASPADFQPALTAYYRAMEGLAATLLQIFAVALNLPENWFVEKMKHHLSALRILNYFEVDSSMVQAGTLRASEHTDYGALTILKSGGDGLQVKKDLDDGTQWVDVPVLENAFVINIGDMMQRWTNDKWVSTLHRVVLPPLDGAEHRRQSMAFFCNVAGDTLVVPMATCVDAEHPARYPPITAREHLMAKHLASMGVTPDDES